MISVELFPFAEHFSEEPASFLSRGELQYFQSLSLHRRKQQFLQTRFKIKQLLAAKLKIPSASIEFGVRGEGKPCLLNSKQTLDFSISHTDDFGFVGLSENGLIGVDVEKVRLPQNFEQVIEKVFTEREIQSVLAVQSETERAVEFTKYWSLKEAIIKAVGGGVFKHSQQIEIDCTTTKILKLPSSYGAIEQWSLKVSNNPGGVITSVALRDSI